MELFSLTKRDIELTLPKDGAIYNLPEGVGALGLKLLARTKASQTRRADVWIAHTTSSGLSAGKWWCRFLSRAGHLGAAERIFMTDSTPWDSEYFRTTFLYPWLTEMKAQGNTYLRGYDGSYNNSIPDVFYSLGCF